MMFAVTFTQLVEYIIATSFVHARRKFTERLTTKCARVQQRGNECARAFGPVIVTSIAATTPCDVN
jgi:hypothetical protein